MMQLRYVAVALALCSLAVAVERGPILHHHSLEAPFINDWWQEGVPHWDVGGDTVVTDKFIRLTPAYSSRFGWAWNQQPNDNPWWEIRASFYVRSKRNPGADGLAFWYVNEPYKGEQPGPLFGMNRQFKGIGVLFDSYDNDGLRDNPITLLVTNAHGETNSWDMDHDLMNQAALRCPFEHRNSPNGDPIEMILTYVNKKLTLRVRSQLRNIDTYCGEINDIELEQNYYFGVTATTGHLVDNHDLVSFEVRALGDSLGDPQIPLEHFDHDADSSEKSYWSSKNQRQNGEEQQQQQQQDDQQYQHRNPTQHGRRHNQQQQYQQGQHGYRY